MSTAHCDNTDPRNNGGWLQKLAVDDPIPMKRFVRRSLFTPPHGGINPPLQMQTAQRLKRPVLDAGHAALPGCGDTAYCTLFSRSRGKMRRVRQAVPLQPERAGWCPIPPERSTIHPQSAGSSDSHLQIVVPEALACCLSGQSAPDCTGFSPAFPQFCRLRWPPPCRLS